MDTNSWPVDTPLFFVPADLFGEWRTTSCICHVSFVLTLAALLFECSSVLGTPLDWLSARVYHVCFFFLVRIYKYIFFSPRVSSHTYIIYQYNELFSFWKLGVRVLKVFFIYSETKSLVGARTKKRLRSWFLELSCSMSWFRFFLIAYSEIESRALLITSKNTNKQPKS
jgi:hypothetical protein